MVKTIHGKCLCGGVAVSMDLEKDTFDCCHCGMCRRWGGGPLFTIDKGLNLKIKGDENIGVYDSSDWGQRGFCKRCGTHLFWQMKGTDFRNFPLGLFEGTDHLKFGLQIFVDRKPHNYDFANKTKTMTEAEVFAKFAPTS